MANQVMISTSSNHREIQFPQNNGTSWNHGWQQLKNNYHAPKKEKTQIEISKHRFYGLMERTHYEY